MLHIFELGICSLEATPVSSRTVKLHLTTPLQVKDLIPPPNTWLHLCDSRDKSHWTCRSRGPEELLIALGEAWQFCSLKGWVGGHPHLTWHTRSLEGDIR